MNNKLLNQMLLYIESDLTGEYENCSVMIDDENKAIITCLDHDFNEIEFAISVTSREQLLINLGVDVDERLQIALDTAPMIRQLSEEMTHDINPAYENNILTQTNL